MKVFCWSPVAAVLSLVAVCGAFSASDVVNSITGLTTLSSNLRTTANSISLLNFIFVAPKVAQGLSNIGATAQQVISVGEANAGTIFDDAGAVEIVDALKTFVAVHQALLSTIIGKHGIIALLPGGIFTEPIRQALVSLEQAVDTLALIVIDMIPTRASDGTAQKDSLDTSLTDAIDVYS